MRATGGTRRRERVNLLKTNRTDEHMEISVLVSASYCYYALNI